MNIGYNSPVNGSSSGVAEGEEYNEDMGGMTLKFVRGYLPPKKKKHYFNYRNTLLVQWPENEENVI
jgi:hypothetical protein